MTRTGPYSAHLRLLPEVSQRIRLICLICRSSPALGSVNALLNHRSGVFVLAEPVKLCVPEPIDFCFILHLLIERAKVKYVVDSWWMRELLI